MLSILIIVGKDLAEKAACTFTGPFAIALILIITKAPAEGVENDNHNYEADQGCEDGNDYDPQKDVARDPAWA